MLSSKLRDDALAIWRAGVDAVRSDRLVCEHVRVTDGDLVIGAQTLPLDDVGRIVVVGAGKAGAGMAAGLEAALGDAVLRSKRVTGWINVPADCVRPLRCIQLHAARPAGVNEPTEAGVAGTQRILQLVQELGPADVCLCLLSGGGSALLPAPIAGITLADKQAVTQHLSGAGANIRELNTVRKRLSRIKGGGLARACRAGQLIALIISDVLGDPLDVIASGPTVENPATPQDALAVLERFRAREAGVPSAVFQCLESAAASPRDSSPRTACRVTNVLVGNNATAVDAAGREAERRGYRTEREAVQTLEGDVGRVARLLAERAVQLRAAGGRRCLISGGEPTVTLAPASARGLGGRNQQLVLEALQYLIVESGAAADGLVLLSGGTDGEDGPTDAAGAVLSTEVVQAMQDRQLSPAPFLARNDAYRFFEPLGGLIKTGPTHTNVCDLRVVVTA